MKTPSFGAAAVASVSGSGFSEGAPCPPEASSPSDGTDRACVSTPTTTGERDAEYTSVPLDVVPLLRLCGRLALGLLLRLRLGLYHDGRGFTGCCVCRGIVVLRRDIHRVGRRIDRRFGICRW